MQSLSKVSLAQTNEKQDPGTRLIFDLSTSYSWRGRPAVGIVRTERELFRHLAGRRDMTVIPVVFHGGAFRALDDEFTRSLVDPDPADAPPLPPSEAAGAGEDAILLARLLRNPALLARRGARRFLAILPPPLRGPTRHVMIGARQVFRNLAYRRRDVAAPPAPREPLDLSLVVHPRGTDILFLGGLNWDVVNWPRIAAMRAQTGMRVVSVMYDLIPMKFPQFLPAPQHGYLNCFLHMIDNSDLIFCISCCTQTDLAAFIAESGRPPVRTEVIQLGSDVPAEPDPTEIADEAIRARLSRGRFALATGSFEIRKNYGLLIDLWEDLMADPAFDLDLVIVGMPGWGAEDVVTRMRALPGFGTRIVWFQRLPDAGLSWLYSQCHLAVFPSHYEGWGLPVVEALQHGRPVLASSSGGTREAGLGLATLLDPDDRAAWKAALLAEAKAPRRSITVPPETLPSWRKSSEVVARELSRLSLGREDAP